MTEYPTGATRDDRADKPDYEGYLSPLVLARYGAYMLAHQRTAKGRRESDNWQRGIPKDDYIKSAWRHLVAWWTAHRGYPAPDLEESLCAVIFNASGYLHEHLARRDPGAD
jgi:hypothetical protein